MHEYSVVQALLEQCEEQVEVHSASIVTKVVVKIGVMSGIETHLLEIAFHTFKEKSVCDGADLVMQIQALTIKCEQCGKISELNEIYYRCHTCKSTQVKVVDGEDMFLMSLEME